MKLLLMRHGEAEKLLTTDFERRLTEAGREEVRKTALLLRSQQLLMANDEDRIRVAVSPYLRARETADLMVTSLGLPAPEVCEAITPDKSPIEACETLSRGFSDCSMALAVMHQPIISRLILYLTGCEQHMGTANLAVLEAPILERGCCDLICVL